MLPSQIKKRIHGDKVNIKNRFVSEMIRLDNIIKNKVIDILKLDIQGYELEALKGCKKILSDIRIINIEVEFIPLYENQPLFSEVDIFLRNNGFRLYNLYELWTGIDGQLTAGDAVYLNEKYFN